LIVIKEILEEAIFNVRKIALRLIAYYYRHPFVKRREKDRKPIDSTKKLPTAHDHRQFTKK
jgi:hypothetical protein